MWNNLLWVGLGGFAGSILRYLIGQGVLWFGNQSDTRFPVATLIVNVVGSFLIGLLLRHTESGSTSHLLGVVGFCGGFTTFSAFSFESLKLLREGHHGMAGLYIALSLILCIGAAFLGWIIKTTK